jgi:hypothetical protein
MSAQNNHQFDFENFQGFSPPYYTPVPDLLFDEIMQDLNAGELKTLLYIIRRTFGFKRSSDDISLAQMLNGITTKDGRRLDRGVGLSKPTLLKSLRTLKEKNLIEATRNRNDKQGDVATTYRLKMDSGGGKETLPPRGKKSLPGGWSKNFTTQETVIQETEQHEAEVDLNNNSSGEPDTKHDVVVALTNKGIAKTVAQRLAHRYSRKRILEKIEYLEYLQETDPQKVTNPRGWLRRAIEDDYGKPDGFKSRAEREDEAAAAEKRRQAIIEQEKKRAAQEEEKREQERREREEQLAQLRRDYKTPEATQKVWSEWKSQIRARTTLGKSLVLNDCELLALQDTRVVLWAATDYAVKEFNRLHAPTIRKLAAKHLKIPLTTVEIKLITPAQHTEDTDP